MELLLASTASCEIRAGIRFLNAKVIQLVEINVEQVRDIDISRNS